MTTAAMQARAARLSAYKAKMMQSATVAAKRAEQTAKRLRDEERAEARKVFANEISELTRHANKIGTNRNERTRWGNGSATLAPLSQCAPRAWDKPEVTRTEAKKRRFTLGDAPHWSGSEASNSVPNRYHVRHGVEWQTKQGAAVSQYEQGTDLNPAVKRGTWV